MPDPNAFILYVKSPSDSAAFYARLLGREPAESSPGFAMFVLASGATLGLWATPDVLPAATAPGGTELCFQLDSRQAVAAMHRQWQQLAVPIIQAPTDMDFGHTFTALDPDGHRLRVFVANPS
jgi:catechol 2,3-dioxygenase-like lactoylglutathione lyase family enzyme